MPFNYAEGEDERIRAGKEVSIPNYYISDSSFAAGNVAEGKRLYELMCAHCHGAKGAGDGKVITVGQYPSVPPAYNTLKDRTLGQYFILLHMVKTLWVLMHLNWIRIRDGKWQCM